MQKQALSFFISLALAFPPVALSTVEVGDARFSPTWQGPQHTLQIVGSGAMYWLFFEVAAGALYLPEGMRYTAWTSRSPKRLELVYFREVKAEDIVRSSWKGLRNNLSANELSALRPDIDHLHQAYRAVRPGDRYCLTYLPGRGTILTLNDRDLVLIPGARFAKSYFQVWLGEYPINEDFRKKLIGSTP